MMFSTYILFVTYLITTMGLVALSLIETIDRTFILIISAVVALTFLINLRGGIRLPRAVWNISAVVVFILFLSDYYILSRSLIDASARFLSILIILRLIDLRGTRDYLILFILNFFQLLAAASSTASPLFFLILFLYVVSIIWGMAIFTLKREWDNRGFSGTEMPKDILRGTFFIGTVGLTIVSIVITLSIFFLIPRMGLGFFDKRNLNIIKMSGFSEEIMLGSIGSIKEDRTIVMRVEIEGSNTPPQPLYFRGITLDLYDGYSWKQTIKDRITLVKDKSGLFSVKPSKKIGLLKQNVLLEPIDTNIIFTAFRGIAVEGRFSNIMVDPAGSFYMRAPSFSRFEYTAYSILPEGLINRSYNSIDSATFTTNDTDIILDKPGDYKGVLDKYLQLPEDSDSLKGLLQGLVDKDDHPFRKAKAIEGYLKKNYRYTLNPKYKEGVEPLEDFLFFSKEGYCEQFATAMAILLRTAGIPSRVVTGFLSGEWNRFGSYLIVRQKDAHSWVETFLPGTGWVLFDPTPQAGTVIESQTPAFLLYLDSLRWKWHRYIVNYSLSDQIQLTKKFQFQTYILLNGLRETFRMHTITGFDKYRMRYMILILIILLLTLSLIRIFKLKNIRRNYKTPDFYLMMIDILKKKGFVRKPSETPFEFAKRCGNPAVLDITIIYTRVRFGNRYLTSGILKEVKNRLQVIRVGFK